MLRDLSQVAPEHVVEVLEQRFRRPNHKGEQRKRPELLTHSRQTEAGQQRLLTPHHHVHRKTDQGRWCEVKKLVEQRTCRGRQHQTPLRRQEHQQSPQRRRLLWMWFRGWIRHGFEPEDAQKKRRTKQEPSKSRNVESFRSNGAAPVTGRGVLRLNLRTQPRYPPPPPPPRGPPVRSRGVALLTRIMRPIHSTS